MITGLLATRTVSAFPLSIGTSLAFESLFEGRLAPYDPQREIPNKIDIRQYQELWVNLQTLFRNIVGSIEAKQILQLTAVDVAEVMIQEMEVIESLLQVEGHGVCQAVFYAPTYKTAYTHQRHPGIKLRMDTTDHQKVYTALLINTLTVVRRMVGDKIRWIDVELIPDAPCKALVMSHFPIDLLSHTHFQRLDLLETHTGKLKPKSLWYTKFAPLGKEDLSTLPFIRKLHVVFGDKVMFHPMDFKLRKLILDTSRQRMWTPMTTESKVLYDLDLDMKDRLMMEIFRKF